jgi:hypothetical protein
MRTLPTDQLPDSRDDVGIDDVGIEVPEGTGGSESERA